MNPFEREEKKKQLRQGLIDAEEGQAPEGEAAGAPKRRKIWSRNWKQTLGILLVIFLAGVLVRMYLQGHRYSDYRVLWEKEIPSAEGGYADYADFGSNVLKYTRDGASYIDAQGKTAWSISYEMKAPLCSVDGDYAVIADQQGNSIYICNTQGATGNATTVLPILRASVSAHGIVAALVEDNSASYVTFFKSDGSTLDWGIKTVLSGNGYLLDVGLSPDGTQVMLSDAYLAEGTMASRIAFYNFSEYGKNYPDRLVGGFDELGTALSPRVRFLSDRRAVAFGGGKIGFFSLENVTSPSLLNAVSPESEMQGIAWSDRYVAVVTGDPAGAADSRLYIYSSNGKELANVPFSFSWEEISIRDDLVILHNDTACKIIGTNGKVRFDGSFDFPVSHITRGPGYHTLMVIGGNTVRKIRMK